MMIDSGQGLMRVPLFAVLVLSFSSITSGLVAGSWERQRVGRHWSSEAQQIFEEHARGDRLGPNKIGDYVAEGGTVSISPAGEGRVLVAHLPASGALELTLVSPEAGGLKVGRSWTVAEGLMVGPDGRRVLTNKLALDWRKSNDKSPEFWYVDPWSWRLVRCRMSHSKEALHVSAYEVPWKRSGPESFDLNTPQVDLLWAEDSGVVHLVRTQRNGTFLYRFGPAEARWKTREVWQKGLMMPRLLAMPDDDLRIFGSRLSPQAGEMIAEVAAQSGGRSVVVDEANYVGGYVVVEDVAGRAHIIYQDHSLETGGATLRHTYEHSGSWHTETVAKVGKQGVDLDREPIRADLCPAACFDAAGNLHLSYFDFSADQVRHASNISGRWRSEMIAPAEAVSCTDVTVAEGKVFVAYGDVLERKVYLAVADMSE